MEPGEEPDRSMTGSSKHMVVICRICLSSPEHMISIHSTVPEYNEKSLYTMLLCVCLPLNEREMVPGLPEQICRNCKWKLLSAYDLYETTLASDEQLRTQAMTSDVGFEMTGKPEAPHRPTDGGIGERILPRNGATCLKRPRAANDQSVELKEPKRVSLACVKEEALDITYPSELDMESMEAPDDTMEEMLDGSKAEAAVSDRLEAMFEEHYEYETTTGNHVCGLCKKDFSYKSQCRLHIVQKHNPDKPFKCDVCFCTLSSQLRLARHKITTHSAGRIDKEDAAKTIETGSGEVTYTCPICRKVFNSSVRFKRHKNVHVVYKRPFSCEVCLYRFATKAQLTQHAKLHETKTAPEGSPGPDGSDGPYECDRCGEMFPGKRARTMHMKKEHKLYLLAGSSAGSTTGGGSRSEERERSDEYTCIICQASFARETVLNTHMKMHELIAAEKEKEKRFDLERLVKQELQQQMLQKVPPLPPLSPEVVDKSNHILEPFVLGLVPVVAKSSGPGEEVAGNATNNNNSSASVNNYSDAPPPSSSGGDANRTEGEAVSHKRIEKVQSDIAYMCTICEKEFDEREQLKKHQKEAHPKLNVDIVSSSVGSGASGGAAGGHVAVASQSMKSFLPPLTAKPGLMNGELSRGAAPNGSAEDDGLLEIRRSHELDSQDHENDDSRTENDDDAPAGAQLTPFRCELCHKTFSYKCYLTLHMQKNHDKSKPYGCKVCHYRFRYRGTLQRHQLIHSSQNVRPGGLGSIIFKCRICSAKFLELKHLNVHLKSHRKPADDPYRKVQLIQCHECSQIFSDRDQFRQHMAKEHENVLPMKRLDGAPVVLAQKRRPSIPYRPGQVVQKAPPRLAVGSSSSLADDAPSPLVDLKLNSESKDEEDDESYLDDLSIVKMEPNYE